MEISSRSIISEALHFDGSFGPTASNDPMEALIHLKQIRTVTAYNAQFETLSNCLKGSLIGA